MQCAGNTGALHILLNGLSEHGCLRGQLCHIVRTDLSAGHHAEHLLAYAGLCVGRCAGNCEAFVQLLCKPQYFLVAGERAYRIFAEGKQRAFRVGKRAAGGLCHPENIVAQGLHASAVLDKKRKPRITFREAVRNAWQFTDFNDLRGQMRNG